MSSFKGETRKRCSLDVWDQSGIKLVNRDLSTVVLLAILPLGMCCCHLKEPKWAGQKQTFLVVHGIYRLWGLSPFSSDTTFFWPWHCVLILQWMDQFAILSSAVKSPGFEVTQTWFMVLTLKKLCVALSRPRDLWGSGSQSVNWSQSSQFPNVSVVVKWYACKVRHVH